MSDQPIIEVRGSQPDAEGRAFLVRVDGEAREYAIRDTHQESYADLFAALAADLGCRMPANRRPAPTAPPDPRLEPLLTENLSPDILHGYGDPCVLQAEDAWWLVATSNDAPQSFPILRSTDLLRWAPVGFVFPAGGKPAWTLDGPGVSDFWAPEMHRVSDEYWICFTARERDGRLAIGLAKGGSPAGPFTAAETPLLSGEVIDAHILADAEGPILYWKEDRNGLWPGLLSELLHERPELIPALFPLAPDRRTAEVARALEPWSRTLRPMERFCVLQVLIEAATADFAGFKARLAAAEAGALGAAILEAMTTRVFAQRLAADGGALLGEPQVVLQNDQAWEAHLIEGMWVTRAEGRYWMFYSGNDFSTAHYGVGVAVADSPFGPFSKQPEPFLKSNVDWWGPGHPSVAPGPDGRPRLFLHAFRPGRMGYKVFRALVTAPLVFDGAEVRVERRTLRGVA